jgi:hypothetical protein
VKFRFSKKVSNSETVGKNYILHQEITNRTPARDR